MSKDLEKEYKALMDSEAPNLWARIEAGLEEKEKPAGRKWYRIKLWAGLAAACACAAASMYSCYEELSADCQRKCVHSRTSPK